MPVGVYKHKSGWHHTEETKRKIREDHLGHKHSKETIKKMSELKLANPVRYWLGKDRPSHSEETKKMMSETHKRIGTKPPVRRGEKNNKWKGGISRASKTGYYSTEYKQWRINVFKRDSFTCQICHHVGGCLNAHHIKSFAKYPSLRFDIDNGVTLCEECHKMTHRGSRKGN